LEKSCKLAILGIRSKPVSAAKLKKPLPVQAFSSGCSQPGTFTA